MWRRGARPRPPAHARGGRQAGQLSTLALPSLGARQVSWRAGRGDIGMSLGWVRGRVSSSLNPTLCSHGAGPTLLRISRSRCSSSSSSGSYMERRPASTVCTVSMTCGARRARAAPPRPYHIRACSRGCAARGASGRARGRRWAPAAGEPGGTRGQARSGEDSCALHTWRLHRAGRRATPAETLGRRGRAARLGVELHVVGLLLADHDGVDQVEVHQRHHLAVRRLEERVLDVPAQARAISLQAARPVPAEAPPSLQQPRRQAPSCALEARRSGGPRPRAPGQAGGGGPSARPREACAAGAARGAAPAHGRRAASACAHFGSTLTQP